MMKLFPSQKDAAKQMILLPSKIHQFKASYFLGIAGAWLSRCAGTTPPAQRLQHRGLAAVTAPSKSQPVCTVRSSLLEAQISINVGSEVLPH